MGNNFLKRINTRIFILPFSIFFICFFCIGIAAYYFDYPYSAKEFNKLRLINLLKEKGAAINILLGQYTRAISVISENANIRNDVMAIINSTNPNSKKAANARDRISKFIYEMHTITDHRMFAILLKDGVVVHSSREALIGEDWSGRDIFKKAAHGLRQTIFVGFTDYKDFDSGMIFLSPIFDFSDELNAILYIVVDTDRLSGLLKIEDGFYRTGKVYIMDRSNNILLTKDGISISKNEAVDVNNDELYYHFEDLENVPFRLVAAINKAEIERSSNALIHTYLFFIGFFIIAVIIQSKFIARRIITMPLKKLINAADSAAKGNIKVDLGGRFSGELLELRNALDSAIKKMSQIKADASKRIYINELISEIEDYAKGIVSARVELIVECDDAVKAKAVHSGLCIKYILMTLINNAARSTDSGVITLLSSLIKEDGIEHLEFFVADTGRGIEGMDGFASQLTDDLLKEISSKSSPFIASGISTVKTLAESIGGRIYIENIPGRGVVSTVIIPT